MNIKTYELFQALSIDTSCIGISKEINTPYFCTPIGAEIIGWDNGIHDCFIQGQGEMIFTVNPETCCDYYVYPIAKNFTDFLRLVLATHGTNTIQQIILWDKQQYTDFVNSPDEIEYSKSPPVKRALTAIQEFGLSPMPNPYEYVTNIQKSYDYTQIPFSDNFYAATGLKKTT